MPRPHLPCLDLALLMVPLGVACGHVPEPSSPGVGQGVSSQARVVLEDFERDYESGRWAFSAGEEFPGAAGRFEKSPLAARTGDGGGRLSFDFSGGGNYVAVGYSPPQSAQPDFVRAWIRNPGGNGLAFRYTDQTGQVFQKPFQSPSADWVEVAIDMDGWDMHFGGANDGVVHGAPMRVAFLVLNDRQRTGHIDFDDVRLMPEVSDPPSAGTAVAPALTGEWVDDFEGEYEPGRWSFSAGEEFPGAAGGFERSSLAAHTGDGGGRLSFDFSGGGNYVAAGYSPPEIPQPASVRAWIRNPSGNGLTFRYTDQTGQVLQKPLQVSSTSWTEVSIVMEGWDIHFGGTNDGVVHGAPSRVAFLISNNGQRTGHVDLDEVRFVPPGVGSAAGLESSTYVAARGQDSGWSMRALGDGGQSNLRGSTLAYDFSKGASTIELTAPAGSLLGQPRELHIRLRGGAPGHRLRLRLATHLMTFERELGELTGEGVHELVVAAPPGDGWTWFGGENDGKLHGPLRIESVLLDRGQSPDRGELELLDISVVTAYPPRQSTIVLAGVGEDNRSFEAVLRSLNPRATEGELGWVIRDWNGRAVREGRREVVIPPLAESLTVPVPVPDGNHPFLEAEFSLRSVDTIAAPARASVVAPPAPGRETQRDADSPFGMGVYLYRYLGQAQQMERVARLAQRVGVKWTREVFRWTLLEPAKGQFDWTAHDQMVAAAKRNGMSVYGVLCYWAPWTKPYTPEGIADYCRYAEAVARRYRDEIDHWEIWNEPNIFFWQGPRDMYAELLEKAYAAIKRGNPAAKILGCSAMGIDPPFIKRNLELGAPFDILTIHPYRSVLDDLGFIEELRDVAELIELPGGAGRPIWITEMGWSTQTAYPWGPREGTQSTQREQAELLARSYIDALASGVTSNFAWYDFRDDGADPFYGEQNMGVLTHDLRPKPSYRAFATLTAVLGDRRFERQLDLADGVIAFRFVDANGRNPVVAFWSVDQARTVTLPSDRPIRLIDLMGQEQSLATVDGEVQLRARPGCPSFAVLE